PARLSRHSCCCRRLPTFSWSMCSLLEYVLGFLFGWGIFQALFMRAVIGGSYALSLRSTFIPELTSMNCLMAGMMVVTMIGKTNVPGGTNPSSPAFWFIMSMGLLVGLCATYP